MGNFKYISEYHDNYVNYLISKIYGKPFTKRPDMTQALAIIESVEDEEVKEWLYLRYIKNMTYRHIEEVKGWSKGKQYNLKCKALMEV